MDINKSHNRIKDPLFNYDIDSEVLHAPCSDHIFLIKNAF